MLLASFLKIFSDVDYIFFSPIRFFTISFRSFSPMPNTLEFKAGQDYYFISTSTKLDIHRWE
jgi:hypothetical protein